MHNGNWNDHMDGGGWWWWIPMMVLMVAFVGALAWLVVVLARGTGHSSRVSNPVTAAPPASPARPTAQDILAERLARGEIEPEDYRRRLEALAGSVAT
jgi:putative membrane protein